MISIIFAKSLHLDSFDLNDNVAITLISADMDRISIGLKNIHELCANILEVALGTWLLQRQVGMACLPIITLCIGDRL